MATRTENLLAVRTVASQGQRGCTLFTPSFSQSVSNCAFRNTDSVAPISSTLSQPVGGNISSGASIPSLFAGCRPFNIAFFVMSFIVDAVKGMFRRWFSTNIFQELLKRVKAELDTPLSVTTVVLIARISTTILSPRKGFIFRGVNIAMPKITFTRVFDTIAPARKCQIAAQHRTSQRAPVATVAETVPHSFKLCVQARKTNNEQTVKALTCKDFDSGTKFSGIVTDGKLIIRHFVKDTPLMKLLRVDWMLKSFQPALSL